MHNTKPKASSEVKTLFRAKELIRELQQKMGLLKTSDHVPAPTPAPVPKTIPTPVAKPMSPPALDLASLTPAGLRHFFENSTTAQLRELLSAETSKSYKLQDPIIVGALYRELKGRRQ